MALQYRDIETNEVEYANSAARAYELFKEGNYKESMAKLYEDTIPLKMSLAERRELKILELKESCTSAITAGFSSSATGHSFGFNTHDQDNFTQQLGIIGAGGKNNVRWKTKDSGPVEFTVDDFMKIIMEGKGHKESNQEYYWELEKQVLGADKENDIHVIKWEK